MSSLVLVAAAVAWLLSWRSADPGHVRIAAGVQLAGAVLALVMRSDLPPDGWAGSAVVALSLPALLVLLYPDSAHARALRAPMVFAAASAALFAAAEPGAGIVSWVAWSVPHIVLAVGGLGAAFLVALLASTRLRGRMVPLLALAVILTALPLIGPRASTVRAYSEGEAATVRVALQDRAKPQGVVRTLPARVTIPAERPLRQLVALALLVALGMVVLRGRAGYVPAPVWVRRGVLGLVCAHALFVASALIPRPLGSDAETVAIETVRLEASTLEVPVLASELPGDLTGGPGSSAVLLPLALLALGLVALGFARPLERPKEGADDTIGQWELRTAILATLLLAGTVLTGLAWSNHVWGGLVVPDPKLFAVIIALVAYAGYFVALRRSPSPSAPAWFALGAFLVLLLSMLGPELGWTAPSLHAFGA